jgi:hypothetical protein
VYTGHGGYISSFAYIPGRGGTWALTGSGQSPAFAGKLDLTAFSVTMGTATDTAAVHLRLRNGVWST